MNKKRRTNHPVLCKTRQTHACGPKNRLASLEAVCQKCGRKFVPARKWQIYCSTKCRKLAWFKRLAKVEILNDHERRLQALERKFGIETPGPGYRALNSKSSPVMTRPGEPRQPGDARSEVPASPERQARSSHRVNASRQPGRVSAQGAIMKGE
jgi:hypothetical protein